MSVASNTAECRHYDKNLVRSSLAGHWIECLTDLTGATPDQLQTKAGACWVCRDGDDRYSADSDINQTGGAFCGKCGGGGDGFALLAKFRGKGRAGPEEFNAVGRWAVERNLACSSALISGNKPENTAASQRKPATGNGHPSKGQEGWKRKLSSLMLGRGDSTGRRKEYLRRWAQTRKVCDVDLLVRSQVRVALHFLSPINRYDSSKCIVFVFRTSKGNITGYQARKLTGNEFLHPQKSKPPEKSLSAKGSRNGWFSLLDLKDLLAADTVVFCEGPPDVVALQSLLPRDTVAVTNMAGAGGWPKNDVAWLNGKKAIFAYDQDEAGSNGASKFGRALTGIAHEVRIVDLPFQDESKPGKDVSDWLSQGYGWKELKKLIDKAEPLRDDVTGLNKPDPPQAYAQFQSPSVEEKASTTHIPVSTPERTFEGLDATDLGNAEFFSRMFNDRLLYCHSWRTWLVWDGSRWSPDKTESVTRLAKEAAIETYSQAVKSGSDSNIAVSTSLSGKARLTAMVELARSNLAVAVDKLDQNEFLLNCANGTVDVRTGELTEHQQHQFITKVCPTEYHADAYSTEWTDFLTSIFVGEDGQPDSELLNFVQRFFGYCLTASVREQVLPVFWGVGSNGKSTLLNAFLQTIGTDYSIQAAPELLMSRTNDRHPTERADLCGKRFVSSVETDDGARLAESTVKILTGGENIRARKMKQDFWEFAPTHKLVLCTNHRPEIRGTDHAIWRRMLLVPFLRKFTEDEKDPDLPSRLRDAREAVLAWAVQGAIQWSKEGLNPPGLVRAETKKYRDTEDVLGRFHDECCEVAANDTIKFADLYKKFEEWAEEGGQTALSKKAVGTWLSEKYEGFTANGKRYRGLTLKEFVERDDDLTEGISGK